jgi:hypothetical protein
MKDWLYKARKNIMNRSSIKLLLILNIVGVTNYHTVVMASTPATSMPIITRETKCDLPADLLAEAQKTNMSILKPTDANRAILYQNYPDGALLFPKNPDIASKFNVVISAIKKNPDLIEFFRKIHINSLNQLYMYLMKIYTNFNLTNPGCLQDTETPTANLSDYLTNEAVYATNKKKLIINHFINLIQSQFGASIISYAPATPTDMAVTLGKVFVHNDCGLDLTPFTKPQTDPAIIASQAVYIQFLQQYMSFFQAYTSYLSKNDVNGVNQYYTIAQSIYNFLHPGGQDQTIAKTNPAMFFYDVESMRSIQFIPFVASTIPTNSQLVPWSPIIVNAAVKNLTSNGHAVAYFKDSAGNKTPNQAQAQSLYLLAETGPVLFEQELLVQPAWLNTQDGAIRILRGCLGDFSALVGTGILDSETEVVIQKGITAVTAQPAVAQPAPTIVQPAATTQPDTPTIKSGAVVVGKPGVVVGKPISKSIGKLFGINPIATSPLVKK